MHLFRATGSATCIQSMALHEPVGVDASVGLSGQLCQMLLGFRLRPGPLGRSEDPLAPQENKQNW